MRQIRFLLLIGLLAIAIAGVAIAQQNELSGTAFEVVSEIGRAVPQSIVYDPNFERYAVIDAYGKLSLVDALTFETQHVLYESGQFNDLAFSHNGRWLALAVETRIELWNAETGQLAADLTDLSQAKRVHGPLTFARDDNLLLFFGTYPAPPALRRFENDTTEVPWLWNLTKARDEGDSTFPRNVESLPFYDYRNGFVLGPDNRIVAALPGRLNVIDAYSTNVLFQIDTARYEQDPLDVWFSRRDNRIYVRPVEEYSLIQVDTQRGVLVEFPLSKELTLNDLQTIGGVELGTTAQVIGGAASRRAIPLLQMLFGYDYRDAEAWRGHPLTVTLIDALEPPTGDEAQVRLLLFVFDEQTQKGQFIFSRSYRASQLVFSDDDQRVLVRNVTDDERIEIYDLASGSLEQSFIPALRGSYYSPTRKNRLLAYDASGDVIISDFQRYNAATTDVITEDLRYSRRFDRFFFSGDNIVTLSGTEWRLWDAATSQVLERKVLRFNGDIIATAPDGSRFLTRFYTNDDQGVEILDAATGQRRSVRFTQLRGRRIDDVLPSPDWEHFLVIYSPNSWGPYYPGNEIAMYSMERGGQVWFIAGDDLPFPNRRSYGWVDNATVYVFGQGGEQPEREYASDDEYIPPYVNNDTLGCLYYIYYYAGVRYETLEAVYPRIEAALSPQAMSELTTFACRRAREIERSWSGSGNLATSTPPAPPVIANVPMCLLSRYNEHSQALVTDWQNLIASLPLEEGAQMAALVCEGIANAPRLPSSNVPQTMMIDAESGERAFGDYTPPGSARPISPVLREFERTEERSMGTAILSPDEQFVAASSLPGELVIYRFVGNSYRALLSFGTATAGALFDAQNRIGALPSPTPTFNPIGTPRPTLTPTITPTPPPRPETLADLPMLGRTENLCPAETLYSISEPPPEYSPTGRLITRVTGDRQWTLNPASGRRNPDESIPTCQFGLTCKLSPDNRWILAFGVNEIFVVRPDGSDSRILFKAEKTEDTYNWPDDIWWSGANTLEYYNYGESTNDRGQKIYGYFYYRDILGVFPDPKPWDGRLNINGERAEMISRQPGGDLVVARTTFSTGVNPGYQYYLYDIATGQAQYFARLTEYPEQSLTVQWHPLGTKLYYYYPTPPRQPVIWYVYDTETNQHTRLNQLFWGTWSPGGRYVAYATDSRAQPLGVWDSQTGLFRAYCIPETGARLYSGPILWSPDERYIALQAGLPKDESQPGVGRHTLILDIETGSVIDLSFGEGPLYLWAVAPEGAE
jgi:hypothetical protein